GCPEAHREGDGCPDPEGDGQYRIEASVPGDGRLGRPVHRPVRHGLGHHDSFQAIANSQNTNLAVVAPGIAEALIATALGLLAAIPATIFYNKFAADASKI